MKHRHAAVYTAIAVGVQFRVLHTTTTAAERPENIIYIRIKRDTPFFMESIQHKGQSGGGGGQLHALDSVIVTPPHLFNY